MKNTVEGFRFGVINKFNQLVKKQIYIYNW